MRTMKIHTILMICLLLLMGNNAVLCAASYNAAVAQVQQQLKILGYNPGPVDGLWGQNTVMALQQFQMMQGLPATGKLDDRTKQALGVQAARQNTAGKAPAKITLDPTVKKIALRRTPAMLSKEEMIRVIQRNGFNHPADYAHIGLSGSITGTFSHKYDLRTFYGEQVIIDHVTGLMWQQAAAEFVPGGRVQTHIEQVNAHRYAGYSDWRLPTIEELASLLESPQKGIDFLDPLFDLPFWFCLSADTVAGQPSAPWVVLFEDGYVLNYSMDDDFYLLLVRSIQ
ncbi:hypothetical protein Despr_2905 [Candidatus Vecturithrix granuli]|uniref:Uncharacterized protein n=1 Tax=Vecturithrix granuli TaxID=1499967 RepID=A0A0S6WCA7_VECG1|nr:hypothetical protein Despr_2905 [Candidatus Vecturithrix granuli]